MLRILAALLGLLCAWPSALFAQSEAKDLSRFQKLFKPSAKSAPSLEERRAAIATIAGYDSKAAAQALVDAYQVATEELQTVLSQRAQEEAELKKLEVELDLGNQGPPFLKGMPPKYPRYLELQRQLASVPPAAIELEGLRDVLRERLSALRAPAAVDWLLAKVIGDEDQPFTLKLSIARAGVKIGPSLVPAMLAALQKAKRPEELLVLIDSLGYIGKPAKAGTPAIVKQLEHGDSAVRERAAWALSQIAAPEGIGPLVARLEKEEDRTQRKLCIALEVLTRQRLGQSVSAWKRWWSGEGTKYASGAVELGGGDSSITAARIVTGGYYHGIPQEGGALVYVIDCSSSMIISIKDPQYENGQPVPPKDPQESRLEACKAELAKAIGELAEGTKFNIVAYSHDVWRYQEQMVVASTPTVKAAQEWIAKLGPKRTTNIHDALGMAFGCGGRGVRDRYYAAEIDTIFLLTDGTPTKPDSSLDSTEKILQAAREWNPFRRVTIHCIGIGSGLNAPFLQQLATEHGGKFVQR